MEGQLREVSSLNSFALGLLLILVGLIWLLPRRLAFCPVFIMVGIIPMGQQIIAAGMHLYLFRIILLTGILRVMVRSELRQLKLTAMDKLFIGWAIVAVVFGSLSKPSLDLLVNRSGYAYNAVSCYFFARCMIVDFEDVVTSVRALAMTSLIVAGLMLVERTTMHNPLFALGGVVETVAMRVGDTAVRCQGAFRHSNLAGVYGATQFPLFVALWVYRREYRLLPLSAMIASIIIVFCAHSSAGILALLAAMAGLALWRWRQHMPLLRRGVLFAIVILAIVMEAPIWYLLAKLSVVTGGEGWHRAYVIDQAVAHFDEWWLFGTTYTVHWAPGGLVTAGDPDMMDITNHYVAEGVGGGALKLGLFLAMIGTCFKGIGRRLRDAVPDSPDEFFVWMMGVTLFAHCLSFISATYFDQTVIVWYWFLASICQVVNARSSLTAPGIDIQFPAAIKTWRYALPKVASSSRFTRSKQSGGRDNDG